MACLLTPFVESSAHVWCRTMASTLSTMKNLLFFARSVLFDVHEKCISVMIIVRPPGWWWSKTLTLQFS